MDFSEVPVSQLISKEYAQERKALISEKAGQYTAGEISAGGNHLPQHRRQRWQYGFFYTKQLSRDGEWHGASKIGIYAAR